MRIQYLHLSACEKCKGPVVAGSLAVRETEISKETELRYLGEFMALCHALLHPSGRLYLQTMLWGKNAPRPRDVSLDATKGSNEYLVAILEKLFPGTWLPLDADQITRAGQPYFHLISMKNGRLDYVATMEQWNRIWRPTPRRIYVALKGLRYFFMDPDFRYKLKTLRRSDNRECFKREVMDHQRMVFEGL